MRRDTDDGSFLGLAIEPDARRGGKVMGGTSLSDFSSGRRSSLRHRVACLSIRRRAP